MSSSSGLTPKLNSWRALQEPYPEGEKKRPRQAYGTDISNDDGHSDYGGDGDESLDGDGGGSGDGGGCGGGGGVAGTGAADHAAEAASALNRAGVADIGNRDQRSQILAQIGDRRYRLSSIGMEKPVDSSGGDVAHHASALATAAIDRGSLGCSSKPAAAVEDEVYLLGHVRELEAILGTSEGCREEVPLLNRVEALEWRAGNRVQRAMDIGKRIADLEAKLERRSRSSFE